MYSNGRKQQDPDTEDTLLSKDNQTSGDLSASEENSDMAEIPATEVIPVIDNTMEAIVVEEESPLETPEIEEILSSEQLHEAEDVPPSEDVEIFEGKLATDEIPTSEEIAASDDIPSEEKVADQEDTPGSNNILAMEEILATEKTPLQSFNTDKATRNSDTLDREDLVIIEKLEEDPLSDEVVVKSYLDSKRSWLMAAACSWIMFWTLLINRTGAVMYVSFHEELGLTREQASWPLSMLGAVSNIFAIISGVLIKKLPLRTVSLLGSVLCSAGILLSALFYNVTAMTICIGIITAIGQGLIFPTNMTVVNTYFMKHRSSASGVSYIGGTLVSFIFPSILLKLVENFRLRGTLFIIGALTLNAVAGSLIIDSPPKSLPQSASRNNNTNSCKPKEDTPKPLWKQVGFLRRPAYYLIVVSGIVFAYVLVLFNVTIMDFGMEKGFEKDHALMSLWFYAGGDFVGRLFSGQLSDRKILRRRTVMSLTFFTTAISMFSMSVTPWSEVYFSACLLYGLSAGSGLILFSVLLTEYLGLQNLPLSIGFHCLANGLTALPRPTLIGYFKDSKSKSYVALYLLLAILSMIMSLAWLFHGLYLRFFVEDRALREQRSNGKRTVPINGDTSV